jgi:RNA polymerase sigma-70 factor (ECF subfamily)
MELASEWADEASSTNLEDETIRRLVVSRAVGALDERDRELIALRYGSDLTARQIAELLGARTNAIEVALHRALGRLRESFGDEDESAPVRKREASR